jgi:hypothetical protein
VGAAAGTELTAAKEQAEVLHFQQRRDYARQQRQQRAHGEEDLATAEQLAEAASTVKRLSGDHGQVRDSIAKHVWGLLDMDDAIDISDDECERQIAAAVILTHNQVKHFAHGDTDYHHHLSWDAPAGTPGKAPSASAAETAFVQLRQGFGTLPNAAETIDKLADIHDAYSPTPPTISNDTPVATLACARRVHDAVVAATETELRAANEHAKEVKVRRRVRVRVRLGLGLGLGK